MFDDRVQARRPGHQTVVGQAELEDLAAPFPSLLELGAGDLETDTTEVGS